MVELPKDADASKMRREAQRLQHIGKYAEAVQLQVALMNLSPTKKLLKYKYLKEQELFD